MGNSNPQNHIDNDQVYMDKLKKYIRNKSYSKFERYIMFKKDFTYSQKKNILEYIAQYKDSDCFIHFIDNQYDDNLFIELFNIIIKYNFANYYISNKLFNIMNTAYENAEKKNISDHENGFRDFEIVVLNLKNSCNENFSGFTEKYYNLYIKLKKAKFYDDGLKFNEKMQIEKKHFDDIIIPKNYEIEDYINFNKQSKKWDTLSYNCLNYTFIKIIEVCKTKNFEEIKRLLIFRINDDSNKIHNHAMFVKHTYNISKNTYKEACNILIQIIGQSVYDHGGIEKLKKLCEAAGKEKYNIEKLFKEFVNNNIL